MRLVAVEVRRFWARRAIAVTLLVTLGAALVLAGATVWSTRSATEAEVVAAQQQRDAEALANQDDLARCLEQRPEQSGGSSPQRCSALDPQVEWFLPRPVLDLEEETRGSGLALAMILSGAAIVAGATFAGADWQTRSISTQLLFRPRRGRLWAAKALAVGLNVTVVAAVVTTAYWSALGLVSISRDLPLTTGALQDITLQGARSVVLAAAAAVGAYALTMAMRSTLATLAVLFAYAAAGEALLASLPIAEAGQWSLANNVRAWVLDGIRVYDENLCSPGAGAACDPTFALSGAQGGLYLLVLLATACLLSVVSFRRRDLS